VGVGKGGHLEELARVQEDCIDLGEKGDDVVADTTRYDHVVEKHACDLKEKITK